MSGIIRKPTQRRIYKKKNSEFLFSKELSRLKFCDHLTDFRCFCSNFDYFYAIFFQILLENLFKLSTILPLFLPPRIEECF